MEDLGSTSPRRLRGVHRRVRVPDQIVGLDRASIAQRDPDAGADEHLAITDLERSGKHVQHPRRHRQRLLLVHIFFQQDDELVPAETSDGVQSAHSSRSCADGDEQLVTDVVPEAVVHSLEAVKVEEEHREGSFVSNRQVERVFETVTEHRTIRKTGERVVERLAGELLLQGLAFRDVARVEHEAFH